MDFDEFTCSPQRNEERDFDTGKRMFTAAARLACHRFGNAEA